MGSSAGKRRQEQQKLEKARAKARRREARRAEGALAEASSVHQSEPELIEDLGALYRSFEAGDLSPEDFEERRDRLQAQFEQLSR